MWFLGPLMFRSIHPWFVTLLFNLNTWSVVIIVWFIRTMGNSLSWIHLIMSILWWFRSWFCTTLFTEGFSISLSHVITKWLRIIRLTISQRALNKIKKQKAKVYFSFWTGVNRRGSTVILTFIYQLGTTTRST